MDSLQRTFLEWQEDQVASWIESIGFPNHTDSIHQHGITGDVLSVLSSEDLKDVGISSLGQRLSILKHVYQLKLEHGIPLEKDSWVPSSLDREGGMEASFLNLYSEAGSLPSPGSAAEMLDIEELYRIVNEQNERLYYLEQEHQRLQGTILQNLTLQPTASTFTSVGPPPAPSSYSNLSTAHPSSANQDFMVKRQPSFKWATFGKRSPTIMSTPAFFDPTTSASRQASMNFGGSNAGENWSERSGSPGIELGVTPPRTAPLARPQPPLTHTIPVQAYPQATSPSIPTHPSIPHFSTSSSAATSPTEQSRQASGFGTGSSRRTELDSKETEGGRKNEKDKARKSSRSTSAAVLGTAENPQRFKVTLEDPCWKVLPAALKKYKINDDWRMYALFICYGNTGGTGTGTERCLSYDEKPLLLFQKLKEASQSPVFMLRHIRDIKSPIAIAQSKVQSRQSTTASADNSASTSENLSSQANTSSQQASTSSNPHPSASIYARANRLAEGTTRDTNLSSSGNKTGSIDGGDGVTYAISIYPYVAEREDEFGVNIDDTFVVLAKAKGWWVVQCDPQSAGRVPIDTSKAGWVPAGCLLECSRPSGLSSSTLSPSLPSSPSFLSPLSDVTPPGSNFTTPTPSSPAFSSSPTSVMDPALINQSNHHHQQRLELDSILSTSFPGVVLMDYASDRPEEMSLKKDETVWMFKRYSHWSYAVKDRTGERGWVPSWFISSQHTTSSTPTTTSASPSTLSTGLSAYQSTLSSSTPTPSIPLTSTGPTSVLSLSGHVPPTMSVGSAMSTPTMEIVSGVGSEILV